MRKVKYQDTGEYGTDVAGYKASNNKYYSSRQAYDAIIKNKELYKKVYNKLQDILEIETSVPPIIIKEINQYKERYDIVLEILLRIGEDIREGLRAKSIENTFMIAKYISACIGNHYKEVEKELDELVTVMRERHLEPPVDLSDRGYRNKRKDLTKFIGVI